MRPINEAEDTFEINILPMIDVIFFNFGIFYYLFVVFDAIARITCRFTLGANGRTETVGTAKHHDRTRREDVFRSPANRIRGT